MNLSVPFRCQFLKIAVFCFLISLFFFSQSANANFADFYSENEDDLPIFSSGGISTSPIGSGYVLVGNSQVDLGAPATYPIGSLARFDDSNTLLWSVFMDTGENSRGSQLIADPGDTSKFFAGFLDDSMAARIALFNGGDLSPIFAHQVPTTVTNPQDAQLSYFPGMFSALLQDLGATVRLMVLNSTGTVVFEKSYASPEFLALEIPFLSTQNVRVSQIPDQSGYYLSIHRADLDLLTQKYKNKFFLINVDNSGATRWSKYFEIDTNAPIVDTSSPGPDNGYFYWITDVDIATSIPTSNLIKLSSAGSLDFSQSIEKVRFSNLIPDSTGDSVYFSGTLSVPNSFSESNWAAAKISTSSGAIEAQTGTDHAMSEFGFLTGEVNGKLYGTILYSDDENFEETTTMVTRWNSDLTSPIGADYSGEDQGGFVSIKGSDDILFSPFEETTGSIGAFSLDADLIAKKTGCESFMPVTPTVINPQLIAVPLSITLNDLSLVVADESSTLSATTLPVEELDLNEMFCPSGGGGMASFTSQPSSQTVAVGEEVNFSVTVDGTEPISYQWKKNDVDIPGATSATYQIGSAETSDAGTYSVVVTDGNGSVTSDPATLTVEAAGSGPSISTDPASQEVDLGSSVTLMVAATGNGSLSYQWFKDNVEIDGATSSSFNLTNIMEGDLATYYVVVSDDDGMATSNPAIISSSAVGNAGFLSYIGGLQIPQEMQGFMDDPDKDNFYSGIEYLMGFDANDASSSPEVSAALIQSGDQQFLSITFLRNTAIVDLSLAAQFSDSIDFQSPSEGVEVSTEDLGGGIERVTQRSSFAVGSNGIFGRIVGGDN